MKKFLSFNEFIEQFEQRPAVQYLWGGIVNKSFGFIFGPSKSGKTIFCENLAMSLAMGKSEFMGQPMNTEPQKVLIVGLEEFWANRAERNSKQFMCLNNEEQALVKQNLMVQKIDFQKYITSKEDWDELQELIVESGAETVIIDSLTRLNHSIIEDSKVAQDITANLRSIKDNLDINLFVIHHSTKNQKFGISMDSMAGSRVFSQEADFALAISRIENFTGVKQRYMKQIFYRYASDDFETVSAFDINPDNIWLEYNGEVSENDLINGRDMRTNTKNPGLVRNFFMENINQSISKSDLCGTFVTSSTMSERTLETVLKDLVKSDFVSQPERGQYIYKNQ